MFSTGFDTLEIYNGYHPIFVGGEVVDQNAELVLRDWMNFLSFGFTPTPVGVSDTHTWIADPAGMPRTLVAVPDDSPTAIAMGIGDDITNTLTGQRGIARDVIVTNGAVHAASASTASGIGHKVARTGRARSRSTSRSRTPIWAPIDTIEFFANETRSRSFERRSGADRADLVLHDEAAAELSLRIGDGRRAVR